MTKLQLPQAVERLLNRLNAAGFDAFAVGGCVRDLMRGRTPDDYDIATSALPMQIMEIFPDCQIVPTGLQHGTVTVLWENTPYEITTFRTDGFYSDGRHPDEVHFSVRLYDDLARRDFTVNAMAYHPQMGLIDPFSGEQDLESGLLRCVGDPSERLAEDHLRILRALRFSSTLGFLIEPRTSQAVLAYRDRLADVSAERLGVEMTKLLCGEAVLRVLMRFPEIIAQVVPELRATIGFNQNNPHHAYTLYEHTARAVAAIAPQPVLRWTMLLHDIGKPQCYTVDQNGIGHFYSHPAISEELAAVALSRLRLDRHTTDTVCLLVRYHDTAIVPTRACIKRWLNRLGEDNLVLLLQIHAADAASRRPDSVMPDQLGDICELLHAIKTDNDCFKREQLAVDGHDLMDAGIPAGPELGQALDRLLNAVIEEQCGNTKDELLAYLRMLQNANRTV